MISIGKNQTLIVEEQLPSFREEYRDRHVFVCQELLNESLKELVKQKLADIQYITKTHTAKNGRLIGKEFVAPSGAMLTKLLHVLLNQSEVLRWVKEITGLENIKGFAGRIYKFEPDEYCFDSWHDDMNESNRLLGLSLNLSEVPYEGGTFHLKNKSSEEVFTSVKHDDWGAAHFFKIAPELHHKVDRVEGSHPRIAFAGWFKNNSLIKG